MIELQIRRTRGETEARVNGQDEEKTTRINANDRGPTTNASQTLKTKMKIPTRNENQRELGKIELEIDQRIIGHIKEINKESGERQRI